MWMPANITLRLCNQCDNKGKYFGVVQNFKALEIVPLVEGFI